MEKNVDLMKELGSLAIASRLKRLSDQFTSEVSAIYSSKGFDINPRYFPILSTLNNHGSLGVTELARVLKLSHPAISQVIKPLEKEGWINIEYSDSDARCRTLSLSLKAQKILNKVEPLWLEIRTAIDEILNTTDESFLDSVTKIEEELKKKPLYNRVIKTPSTSTRSEATIIEWDPKYEASFIDLNKEWIEKYFKLERLDEEIFKNVGQIIENGGMIFFAKLGPTIVGTCAIFKCDKKHYEIAKMAVSSFVQSQGIGRRLLQHVMEYLKKVGAKKVTLESVKSLTHAQKLYKAFGFKEVDLPKNGSAYERVDVAMELNLVD